MKMELREFPVNEDALLPGGTSIGALHFLPGQYVDATGITKGKGCQVPGATGNFEFIKDVVYMMGILLNHGGRKTWSHG